MSIKSFFHQLNRTDKPLLTLHPFTKKILVATFIVFAFIGVKSITAQNIIQEKQKAIEQGSNQEYWLDNALGSNIVSVTNILVGTLPNVAVNLNEDNYQSPNSGSTSWVPGGTIGAINNLTATLYNPPSSGIQYLAQLKDELLGKPAYAQLKNTGMGYRSLQPILPIWGAFRNIVYTLASLFFIIIGIMIMLRVKISQQAVINIQNSIPRMITTLILVTFSYAIAGLLIDFMYFIQATGIYLLFQIKKTPISGDLIGINTNFWQLNGATFSQHLRFIFSLIPLSSYLVAILVGGIGGFLVGGLNVALMGTPIGWIAGIGAVLLLLVIIVVVLIQLLTLLFGLFKAYFGVIMSIVFAPIIIGCGALPNSKVNFESWLKQFLANLVIFPSVFLFLLFTNMLMQMLEESSSGIGSLWAPNVVGMANNIIPFCIGIGAIFIIGKIPTLIPQAVFGIKPSPWGQAMDQTWAGLQRNPLVGGAIGKLQRRYGDYNRERKEFMIKERTGEIMKANPKLDMFTAETQARRELTYTNQNKVDPVRQVIFGQTVIPEAARRYHQAANNSTLNKEK